MEFCFAILAAACKSPSQELALHVLVLHRKTVPTRQRKPGPSHRHRPILQLRLLFYQEMNTSINISFRCQCCINLHWERERERERESSFTVFYSHACTFCSFFHKTGRPFAAGCKLAHKNATLKKCTFYQENSSSGERWTSALIPFSECFNLDHSEFRDKEATPCDHASSCRGIISIPKQSDE